MKYVVYLFVFTLSFSGYSQILNKDIKKTYPTRYYFESQRMQMFRTLVSNDAFLPTPLGTRADELELKAWSHQIGICMGLSEHFYLDGAVSWMQNGESYSFASLDSDSTFNYQTRYRYLALPVQLKYTRGDQLKIFGGLGLVPALYQGFKQELQWTNALGAEYDDQISVNNAMNSFILSWVSSLGIEAQLDSHYAFRFGVMYRAQLNNSYTPYEDYIHKSKGWGLQFGLTKNL
jgi:hypothetical protein